MVTKEMLERALAVCEQNRDLFNDLDVWEFHKAHNKVQKMAYAAELRDKYGINGVTHETVFSVEPDIVARIRLPKNISGEIGVGISSMGKRHKRLIGWPSDGRQPEDEVIFNISFPTGAYIFGIENPTELFDEMWNEIKLYKYKYVDNVNHNIYFAIEDASPIANDLEGILNKYYKRFQDESNIRKVKRLRKELAELEGQINEESV